MVSFNSQRALQIDVSTPQGLGSHRYRIGIMRQRGQLIRRRNVHILSLRSSKNWGHFFLLLFWFGVSCYSGSLVSLALKDKRKTRQGPGQVNPISLFLTKHFSNDEYVYLQS
jgi:hypothetical protein